MKKIILYHEKGIVHPLVQFIREEYSYSWKELGEYLYQRQLAKENNYINPISASFCRRLAVNQSKASWFFPEIASIGIGFWEDERLNAKSDDDIKQIDLKYSAMFSLDLLGVYLFLYAKKECLSEKCPDIASSGSVLANIILNEFESYFEVTFPNIN